MANPTVVMNASAIGGTLMLQSTGVVVVPASGVITVNASDAADLLRRGATYVNANVIYQKPDVAPRVASAGRIVASTSLANGTLSIANQPDIPRVCLLYVDPGTSAITAGVVTANYIANDGTTQIDVLSCVTPASTVASTNLTKGMILLNSVVVSGVVGGATPLVQVNDTNALSVVVNANFSSFTLLRLDADGTSIGNVSVNSAAASVTPSTTPNGTHTFSFFVSYNNPDV
jgi:hypothetical protein